MVKIKYENSVKMVILKNRGDIYKAQKPSSVLFYEAYTILC